MRDQGLVVCMICGKELHTLSPHLRVHKLKAFEYTKQFPDALIESPAFHERRIAPLRGMPHPWCEGDKAPMRNPEVVAKVSGDNSVMRRCPQLVEEIAAKNRGKKRSKQFCEDVSRRMQGHRPSDTTRAKMSRSQTIAQNRPEVKEASRRSMLGDRNPMKNPELVVKCQQSAARSFKGGTRIERIVEAQLSDLGVSFERQVAYLVQTETERIAHTVDFRVVGSLTTVLIECDGCYWHGCTECFPSVEERIQKIVERDRLIDTAFQELGVKFLRFWEHDINSRPEWVEERIREVVGVEVTSAHL